MTVEALQLFYSYTGEDEELRNQLDHHLTSLVRQGLIRPWYDRKVSGGQVREHEINRHLQAAHVILLLISPDFIASDYCYSSEMAEALLRHKEGKARVIPIILRPCYWENIPLLNDLQPLPKNKKPITTWSDRDIVFDEITREIAQAITELHNSLNIVQNSQLDYLQEKQQHTGTKSGAIAKDNLTFPGAMHIANNFAPLSDAQQSRALTRAVQSAYMIPHWLHIPAVYWTRLLSTIVTTICVDVIAGGVGLNVWGPSSVFELVHRYPGSIILCALFILVSIFAWIIAGTPKPGSNPEKDGPTASELSHRLVISSAISTTSSFLCFILLALVILRPSWCPSALCPPPAPVLNQNANNDGTLEVYFTAMQSSLFVISGDPAHYTLGDLPTTIGALRIDQKVHNPYRVVFGIHSLQHGNYGMFIEDILLIVDTTRSLPQPLKVWYKGSPLDYKSNLFQVTYDGEPAASKLDATYIPLPGAHVQLAPGESDEIDLEINSKITIDLHFHIEVTYRVSNESTESTVRLPGNFEMAFSDASNWQQYKLENGHLTI